MKQTQLQLSTTVEKHEYATLKHVELHIICHAGTRLGAIRGLDIVDFCEQNQIPSINHRTQTGTPLENKERSVREVHISAEVTEVITDFVRMNYPHVGDEHRRTPLTRDDI